ncbi:o-succinylbenzoate--CoA ligase [Pradoshia sp.]|uniref:o-succinylbenzoate--CoA ligase n=1 Tax=Pradoshia sp. TaxID=2651281 RepID=UPI003F069074
MKGIAYWIEKRATITPGRIAVITEEEKITYKALHNKITDTAAFLKQSYGVENGDRVAILSQNRLEYLVLIFALAKLGAIAVPLNIRLTSSELCYQLKDSDTSVLIAEGLFYEQAQSLLQETGIDHLAKIEAFAAIESAGNYPFQEINESAPFIICYTSGTTGKPKGAVLTQANMFWNAINNVLAIDLTSADRSIVLLPLFHIGGIGLFALPTLFVGGTVIIPGKFEPQKAIAMIEQYEATIVMGVPAIHKALIECPSFKREKMKAVRWFYNGGAPCPHELIQTFFDHGFLFGQGFGMTETSPTLFMLSREDAPRKIGSIGKPVMYSDFKLVNQEGDVGELVVKGPNIMTEYWRKPAATNETIIDGWLYTGDLARIDEEGFVYIVGRKKEMLISGGENIYPLEIEQAISQHTDVSEVAVTGVADPVWGEVPAAFVVKKPSSELTDKDIIEYCRDKLAKYKLPKEIIFMDELPKNATGKIQKNQLGKLIQE